MFLPKHSGLYRTTQTDQEKQYKQQMPETNSFKQQLNAFELQDTLTINCPFLIF